MDFVQSLEEEFHPRIEELLRHPFISVIRTASLTSEQLRAFALQYTAYCDLFPKCLAAVAANVPDDHTRFALIENLWEEHGSGDLKESHRALFRRFLKSLGISDEQERTIALLPSTKEYVETVFRLC